MILTGILCTVEDEHLDYACCFQNTLYHQQDSQEDTIKNSYYPNPELIHISLTSFQIQLDYGTTYPLKLYMHTQLINSVNYL